MLRHSISFKAKNDFNPYDLPFLIKDWLLSNSRSSGLTSEDFLVLNKTSDIEIEKGKEKVSGFTYHENGLSCAQYDYVKKTVQGIYLTSVIIQKTLTGTYVYATLSTYSKSGIWEKDKRLPASVPNIFKMLMRKSGGGWNGVLSVSNKPVFIEKDFMISAYINTDNPITLPVVHVDLTKNKNINTYHLAKMLYGKASVVVTGKQDKADVVEGSGKKQKSVDSFFKLLHALLVKKELSVQFGIKIFYPDGGLLDIRSTKNLSYGNKVISVIEESQRRQFTPTNYGYIYDQKENLRHKNYKRVNSKLKRTYQIIASLSISERGRMLKVLPSGNGTDSRRDFNQIVDDIIQFPEHKYLLKKTDNMELRKMFTSLERDKIPF